jgi:hypothetical protein
MKGLSYFYILALLAGVLSCKNQPAITTGIVGQVVWVSGNQMPGPDKPDVPGQPVERTVIITEAVKMSDLEGNAPLFSSAPKKVVKKVDTNKSGAFTVELPPGIYSIFIKEEDGYFANSFDNTNTVNPVVVSNGNVSDILIRIDYKASY